MDSVPALELATAMLKQASQPGGLEASLKAAADVRQTADTLASQNLHQTGRSAEQNAERSFGRSPEERPAPMGLGRYVDLTV
jgi:hypothetical protein